MMIRILKFNIVLVFSLFLIARAGPPKVWYDMIGSAYLENQSYRVLERLCDETGGRLVGTEVNRKALQILKGELEELGCEVQLEKFRMPGWVRGNDEIFMLSPTLRKIKAVALGFVDSTTPFTASLVYAVNGFRENYDDVDAKNKIVLVTSQKPKGRTPILRQEAIEIAAGKGAKTILFINSNKGVLNMAGTGDFQGNPTKIPAFSLTNEEGLWLKRLTEKSILPKLKVSVKSYCEEIETANIVLRMPGQMKEKIVVGAHIDSWDLGQGGIDNGLGTAILFDVARLMRQYSPQNYYSLEFVWFNGEELGLFGSKKYIEMHQKNDIIAMINMDMTGSPTGFNAMGFDEFLPVLEELKNELDGFNLYQGVISRPWTNSDHMPFMFQGVPTLSLVAHLDPEMGRYYHSLGDTFDKVNIKYLSEAAAVVSILVYRLANDKKFNYSKKNPEQLKEMLKKFKLDDRLKRQKEWPFGSN